MEDERGNQIFQLLSESQLYHHHQSPRPVRESDIMAVLAGSHLSKPFAPGSFTFRGLEGRADISFKIEKRKHSLFRWEI